MHLNQEQLSIVKEALDDLINKLIKSDNLNFFEQAMMMVRGQSPKTKAAIELRMSLDEKISIVRDA